MKSIVCDRCKKPAPLTDRLQDPDMDAAQWLPVEVSLGSYEGKGYTVYDLCASCSYQLARFMAMKGTGTGI
jgi:hypothetical protein